MYYTLFDRFSTLILKIKKISFSPNCIRDNFVKPIFFFNDHALKSRCSGNSYVVLYYTKASANSGGKTILGGKSHTRKNGIFTTSYTSKYLLLTYEFSLRPNSLQLLLFQLLPSTITILMNEARHV